eukprot:CAMPEP_0180822960 /NCGR_PEP_ID=MMETSP1038_2-20121128/71638_1 /TAXON_ID=632150 /ORGANISM="Azadinium spinosum, Strain 3D9" /LENGTH=147 /DNA_ID=CAMNT_0022865235 /DNA_START=82 /DNA_END=523 /DNA_ORIENTATION=+
MGGHQAQRGDLDLGDMPKQLLQFLLDISMDKMEEELEDAAADFTDDFGDAFQAIADDLAGADLDMFAEHAKAIYEEETAGALDVAAVKAAEKRMADSIRKQDDMQALMLRSRVSDVCLDVHRLRAWHGHRGVFDRDDEPDGLGIGNG